MIINVDTKKVRDCGKDMMVAADSYKSNINNLFNRINGVPTRTKEWIGQASLNYSLKVAKEKHAYDQYGKCLNALGEELVNYASELEKAVNLTRYE